ncbi:MAG: MlaD family protein [Planctomycetota bacterium]
MNSSKYAFQAGLFILIAVTGAILMVARVAENRASVAGRPYTAQFAAGQDISGLVEGAEVRLLGVKVGRVEGISIDVDDQGEAHVLVSFRIDEEIRLREGVRIESQAALTGGGWLNILSTGKGEPLAEASVISARSANLSVVIDELRRDLTTTFDLAAIELTETADAIQDTAEEATSLINKLEGDLDPVLQDYDTFMAEATGVMTDVRAVFGDSNEDIRQTLANLNTISTTFDQRLPNTLDQIDTTLTNIQSFSDEASGLLKSAEASLDNLDGLIDEVTLTATGVNDVLADNRPTIDRMVTNANRAIDELEGMIDDLRANPSRLVWPPDEKDLKNMGLYAAARSYAKAAEDLQLAAAALRAAQQDPNADAKQLERMREALMAQFEHFDKMQDEVWAEFEE